MPSFSPRKYVLRKARLLYSQMPLAVLVAFLIFQFLTSLVWVPGASALTKQSTGSQHKVVILIDSNDEKVMGHAIGYSMNLYREYSQKNEAVSIEVVANGSGITLLRADKSPLMDAIAAVQHSVPGITFSMCDSAKQIAEAKEGLKIQLIPGARLVPFGIGRVVELQEEGWSYIHG